MATLKQLPLPKAGTIRRICHISDIHIPPGTDTRDEKSNREDEFLKVFRKIKGYLLKLKADDMIICITGDIVHDNRKAGAACIKLFYSIVNDLSQVAPVYIIRGNHDYNQASIQDQDILGSFMHAYEGQISNIVYLDKTGIYNAANVSFGLVAIQDVLLPGGTSGCVTDIPDFPSTKDMPAENTKIALFHGDVPGKHPVEWFGEGYKYILLGDLHRMQVHGAKCDSETAKMDEVALGVHMMNSFTRETKGQPIWAYPGSTIQQNYGEPIMGHGFLMWNLTNDMVNAYHVHNEYGFATYRADNNDKAWQLNITNPGVKNIEDNWVNIDKMKELKWFPKLLRLRPMSKKESQYITETEVVTEFAKHGLNIISYRSSPGVVKSVNEHDIEEQLMQDQDADLHVYNEPKEWCNYLEENVPQDKVRFGGWRTWFENPSALLLALPKDIDNILTEDIGTEIKKRNKQIQAEIDTYKTTKDNAIASLHSHHTFEVTYMNWAYILCYKEGHFDFKDLKGQVCCIGGKNGFGKTSFLETICIALFGEGQPSRTSKHTSASIVCQQKPAGTRAFTTIMFKIDDIEYRLTRYFDTQLENKVQTRDITLEKVNKETGTYEPLHSGKVATNEWLSKHLGNIESYLTSCMITQGFDQDFFSKDANKQKEYLDKQLRLESSGKFKDVLKETANAYNIIIKQLKVLCDSKRKEGTSTVQVSRDRVVKLEKEMGELEEWMNKLDAKKAELHDLWSCVDEKTLSKGGKALEAQHELLEKKMTSFAEVDGMSQEELLEKKGVVSKAFGEVKAFWSKDLKLGELDKELNVLEKKQKGLEASVPEETMDVLIAEQNKLKKEGMEYDIKTNRKEEESLKKEMGIREVYVQTHALGIKSMSEGLVNSKKQNEELSKKYEELVVAKPIPPHPELDSKKAAWDKVLKPLVKKHKTIDALKKKLDEIFEPTVEKPKLSDGDLEKKSARLKIWFKVCKIKPDMIKGELEKASDEMLAFSEKFVDREKVLMKMDKEKIVREAELSAAMDTYQKVLSCQPEKPKYVGSAKAKEFDVFEKMKTDMMALEKKGVHKLDVAVLMAIQDHYHKLSADMGVAKKAVENVQGQLDKMNKHEFNARCKCCAHNKSILGISKLEEDLKGTKTILDEVMKEAKAKLGTDFMSNEEYKTKMVQLKERLQYDSLKKDVEEKARFWESQGALEKGWDTWSAEKVKCEEAYKKASVQVQKIKGEWEKVSLEVDKLRKEKAKLDIDLKEIQKLHAEWEGVYCELDMEVQREEEARKAWGAWETMRKDMADDLTRWEELAEQQKFLDQQMKIAVVYGEWSKSFEETCALKKKCLADIEGLEARLKKKQEEKMEEENRIEQMKRDILVLQEKTRVAEEIGKKISLVEDKIKRVSDMNAVVNLIDGCNKKRTALNLKVELDKIGGWIDRLKEMDVVSDELEVVNEALDVVCAYAEWKDVSREIEDKKKKYVGVKNELVSLKELLAKKNELETEIGVLNDYWTQMMDKADTLGLMIPAFGNFKDWVMQARIVPLIKDQANRLLDILCVNHRPISLDCKFDDKGVFTWVVNDGPNNPPIEKASGFQRFVISLATRIALGRMGVAGIKNSQLFIDEGFTACDDDNLQNVPDVLQQLLKLYHGGIVIVSHLDELRSKIHSVIHIDRVSGEGVSQLKFGEVKESMVVVKKRGRPKKVAV
jgi:DNA repair exonuclease SbcCD ATPase subunit